MGLANGSCADRRRWPVVCRQHDRAGSQRHQRPRGDASPVHARRGVRDRPRAVRHRRRGARSGQRARPGVHDRRRQCGRRGQDLEPGRGPRGARPGDRGDPAHRPCRPRPAGRPAAARAGPSRRVGPGLLPADHRGPRGPPLRAAVRADARPCRRARQRPRRSRAARLRRDAGPPRHRPARLLPPAGRPQLPVGHQERARAAAAGAVDPRSAASRHRRRAARSLRAARHPRLAAAAKPGHPRRLRAGQRAARRPRPGGRHHRLRRHRPQRPGDRSRIVAVLRAAHPRRGRRLPRGPDPDRRLPVAASLWSSSSSSCSPTCWRRGSARSCRSAPGG